MSADPAYEEVLPAFATNFEFAKHLVRAQGSPGLTSAAKTVLGAWLSLMIDGVDGYIDSQRQAGADDSPELRTLVAEATEAHDWLNALGAHP